MSYPGLEAAMAKSPSGEVPESECDFLAVQGSQEAQ